MLFLFLIIKMNVCVNKTPKEFLRSELENMTKEELIDKIIRLESHNLQLRNILNKQAKYNKEEIKPDKRTFDFNKSHKRHVLLKIMYFGWDYQGFASQEDTTATIEHNLFAALKKTCLIESRETSNYHRCGRTDKGVSAFCQVISIDLRSKFSEETQMLSENLVNEVDYCGILNKVLPANVKCICWMPLRSKMYSARFDCIQRTYRYFFPAADLDIEEMRKGCSFLIGTHDFRNLCKMDVANGVTNFVRTIISARIKRCKFQQDEKSGYEMFYLEVIGQSYLWHQIRCIMAVLFLIGQGHESATVISELLDINQNACKPQYNLAHGLPLNLYSCEFRHKTSEHLKSGENFQQERKEEVSDTTEWIYSQENMFKLIKDMQSEWSILNIQATMVRETLGNIEDVYTNVFGPKVFRNQINILQGVQQKQYQKLMARKRCESLKSRVAHYVKKRRLIVKQNEEDQSE